MARRGEGPRHRARSQILDPIDAMIAASTGAGVLGQQAGGLLVRSRGLESPLISIAAVVAIASEALPPSATSRVKSALIRFSEERERVACLPSPRRHCQPRSIERPRRLALIRSRWHDSLGRIEVGGCGGSDEFRPAWTSD